MFKARAGDTSMTLSGRRSIQLLLIASGACAVMYGRFALGPLQEALKDDLGLLDNQVALLQGTAIAVPIALGAIPAGLLIDRYRRAPILLLLVAVSILAVLLMAVAPTFAILVFARSLTGFAVIGTLVAAYSLVADLYGPEERGRATMAIGLGEILGSPAAFVLGGFLLTFVPLAGLAGWRSGLLWMSVPLLPIAGLMLCVREPARTGIQRPNPLVLESCRLLWQLRKLLLPLLLARIMIWTADGAILIWGAPTFARTFHLSPDRIGLIMGAVLLVSGLSGALLGGVLADRCQRAGGPRRTMIVMSLLAATSTLVAPFPLMPTVFSASVSLTLFLAMGFIIGVSANAVATIIVPGELRGLYIALTVMAGAIFGSGVAPLLVSALSQWLGGGTSIGSAVAIVSVATSALGTIAFALGSRRLPDASAAVSPESETPSGAGGVSQC